MYRSIITYSIVSISIVSYTAIRYHLRLLDIKSVSSTIQASKAPPRATASYTGRSQALLYYEQISPVRATVSYMTHLRIARFVSTICQDNISPYCLIRYSIVLTFHTVLRSIGSFYRLYKNIVYYNTISPPYYWISTYQQ